MRTSFFEHAPMQKKSSKVLPAIARIATAAVLVPAGLGLATGTASAGPTRGVDGCVAYSYENGFETTTVYFHNRCNSKQRVTVIPGSTCSTFHRDLPANEKASHKFWNCKVNEVHGS